MSACGIPEASVLKRFTLTLSQLAPRCNCTPPAGGSVGQEAFLEARAVQKALEDRRQSVSELTSRCNTR
jgi:hypothetical protein